MKNRYFLFFLYCAYFFCACNITPQMQEEMSVSILLPNSSDYKELFPEGMDSSKYLIKDLCRGHGVVVSGPFYMLFDDSVPQYYRFPFGSQYTDIAWFDGNCYIAKDSSLIFVEDNGKEHDILYTDGVIKKIFPIKEGIYFAGDSTLSFFRFSIAEAEPIIQFKASIHDIYPLNENICFVAVGDYIIQVNKGEAFRVHTDSLIINSIEVMPEGLFFATDSNVCYLSAKGYFIPIIEKGARQLKLLEDNLFIIFNDNSCYVTTNVSNYNQLIKNINDYEVEDSIH